MYSKLKEIRTSKRETCEDLSAILGFKTRGAYHKKETGNVPFTLLEAKAIADHYNLRIEDIFFNNEVSNKDTAGALI
ncbi:MAG: XRE family transcriptional regulator [Oscillospiraceae bacterium]|nr:XRE family transcriptional regulator [Oscillospiraceae bacterium]